MSRGPHAYLTEGERAERKEAYRVVIAAIRRGELVRQPCQKCGDPKTHAHHANGYANALDVQWLCAKDHGFVHVETQQARFAESYRRSLVGRGLVGGLMEAAK